VKRKIEREKLSNEATVNIERYRKDIKAKKTETNKWGKKYSYMCHKGEKGLKGDTD
jgi:hypothetical protein